MYCEILKFLFPTDDLHDARNTIAELTRRLHELEIELRRLENEREELSAAYKEAEAVSNDVVLGAFVQVVYDYKKKKKITYNSCN